MSNIEACISKRGWLELFIAKATTITYCIASFYHCMIAQPGETIIIPGQIRKQQREYIELPPTYTSASKF